MSILLGTLLAFIGGTLTLHGSSYVALDGSSSNGTVDPAFDPGANGMVITAALQPDGKIILGGRFTTIGGVRRAHLARVDSQGALDSSFAAEIDGAVSSITVLDDGSILIGGEFTSINGVERNYLARLNPGGALVTDFDPNVTGSGDFPGIYTAALQLDGKIIIGGAFRAVGGVLRTNIARLQPDGTLDVTFAPAMSSSESSDDSGSVHATAVQADGKIIVGGVFTRVDPVPRRHLARLNDDGSLDADFAPDLSATDEFSGVYAVAVQSDGKILVGGIFDGFRGVERRHLARLNSAGTLDASFDPRVSGTGAITAVFSMGLQADGRIIIGGRFGSVEGVAQNHLARLHPAGTLDSSFNVSVSGRDPGADATVSTVILQADGKVVAGGIFANANQTSRSHVARLTNDAATQSLTVTSSNRIEWIRGGTSPHAQSVTFDYSIDRNTSWTAVGPGVRIAGGWELANISLPAAGWIRARARVTDGAVSSGLVENIVEYAIKFTPVSPIAISIDRLENGSIRLGFSGAESMQGTVLVTSDPSLPRSQWVELGSASEAPAGEYEFIDSESSGDSQRYYVVRVEE